MTHDYATSRFSTAYGRLLALRDLTDAALGPHAMQLLVQHALDALRTAWKCPVVVYRAPPLVPSRDNYDDLGYPPDGASRDARYTRYLTPELLLRTQTSAMIPRALRMIAPARYEDVVLACPGLTYRRDAIDRLHVGEPHQLDLWRITQRPLTRDDLVAMIEIGRRRDAARRAVAARAGGASVHARWTGGARQRAGTLGRDPRMRSRPSRVARRGGSRSRRARDSRWASVSIACSCCAKGIEDIRALRSSDPRIQAQMLDLEPYRAVSSQPPIYRDLSVAVAERGERGRARRPVRSSLAAASGSIESIEVLAETSYLELSLAARRRLGISPHQKNVLLRLVIRDLRAHADFGRGEPAARRGLRSAARGQRQDLGVEGDAAMTA